MKKFFEKVALIIGVVLFSAFLIWVFTFGAYYLM